jgi:hypothetical protein
LESTESAAGDFLQLEERAKVTPFGRGQREPQATFCNWRSGQKSRLLAAGRKRRRRLSAME